MKTILITGSTDGIGRQAALENIMILHCHGHNFLEIVKKGKDSVIIHGRNEQRCQEAVAWIKERAGSECTLPWVAGDFCSLASVEAMAMAVEKAHPQLDVLLCNAGVLNPTHHTTQDGFEMTFQVNHLAHFLLVNRLGGLLEKNAPSRVILVSSICHSWEEIDWDDLQCEKGYEKYEQYSRTKLMNHLFAFALHRRLGQGVASVVLEPGVIHTKLLRNGMGSGGAPVEAGPAAEVFCATADGVRAGAFYNARAAEERPDHKATRDADQDRLWDISAQLLLDKGFTLT